jgi:hypothetical protein
MGHELAAKQRGLTSDPFPPFSPLARIGEHKMLARRQLVSGVLIGCGFGMILQRIVQPYLHGSFESLLSLGLVVIGSGYLRRNTSNDG